jgi:hypothetical protein
LEAIMPSDNAGSKRQTGDEEIPAELAQREAQDRAKPSAQSGGSKSPVDSMHVDAPKKQDNERGHKQRPWELRALSRPITLDWLSDSYHRRSSEIEAAPSLVHGSSEMRASARHVEMRILRRSECGPALRGRVRRGTHHPRPRIGTVEANNASPAWDANNKMLANGEHVVCETVIKRSCRPVAVD